MTRDPRVLVTLEGYAVEGGFDGPYEPATCYSPTIALGRHAGPGRADQLWRDYEVVLDLVPALGVDGIRLGVEWARVEPRRGRVDAAALERYANVVAHARALDLDVTLAVVDAVWPSWLGLEAWLLPWVAPHVVTHAQRLATYFDDPRVRLLLFAQPEAVVSRGFLHASAPPWRRGAREDAQSARAQIAAISEALHADPVVGPRLVRAHRTVSLERPPDELRAARDRGEPGEELYVRSLLRGAGPTSAPAGLLTYHEGQWRPGELAQALSALR